MKNKKIQFIELESFIKAEYPDFCIHENYPSCLYCYIWEKEEYYKECYLRYIVNKNLKESN